jgi:hypothetical protein
VAWPTGGCWAYGFDAEGPADFSLSSDFLNQPLIFPMMERCQKLFDRLERWVGTRTDSICYKSLKRDEGGELRVQGQMSVWRCKTQAGLGWNLGSGELLGSRRAVSWVRSRMRSVGKNGTPLPAAHLSAAMLTTLGSQPRVDRRSGVGWPGAPARRTQWGCRRALLIRHLFKTSA